MQGEPPVVSVRRPRFRRASEWPAFRVTDDVVLIVRHLAGHRFLRSTHISALVGRSLDRTNARLVPESEEIGVRVVMSPYYLNTVLPGSASGKAMMVVRPRCSGGRESHD
jgi:hypothetical protein